MNKPSVIGSLLAALDEARKSYDMAGTKKEREFFLAEIRALERFVEEADL